MKIKIKTLTPVHIGTGKKLGTMEFFNNYRISYDKLFEMVTEEKQDEFYQWIDQKPQISVSEIKNKFNLNPQQIINNCGIYSFNGSFQKDMNEGIKDSSNKLFIPGSSFKGSLRTALMYKVLSNPNKIYFLTGFLDELITEAKKNGHNPKRLKNLLKDADDKLEEEVFICGVEKTKNNKVEISYDDQKYDLLKLIKISDSTSVSTYENGEITELQVYALKKTSSHKKFKIFTESIKDGVELEFDISIDIEFLRNAKKELNNPKSDFGKKYFIGIEKKLKDLFDIDLINDNDFSEEKITNTLIDAIIKFGRAVSNLEKNWVDSIKSRNNINLNSLEKLYNVDEKFKIGFGTGFSGITMLSLLLSNNTLKLKAFDFFKLVGIGFHRSTSTPLNIDEFPFTRKYSQNQNIFGGFGWVKILKDSIDSNSIKIEKERKKAERPVNTVIAEIIDDKSKPPKVKILEGEHSDKVTTLPGVRLEGLGLSKGSQVYVKLHFDKKTLQKAEFKGKVG